MQQRVQVVTTATCTYIKMRVIQKLVIVKPKPEQRVQRVILTTDITQPQKHARQ